MNWPAIRKYIIHILAVAALNNDALDFPMERCAFILCTNRTNRFIDTVQIKDKLTLDFVDVEDKDIPGAFNEMHARSIIVFFMLSS